MAIAGRRLTLEEFRALPEQEPPLELIDGEVREKVSPRELHAVLQAALAGALDGYARPRRLARAFTELRGTYGDDSLLPDIAVIRWERIARDARGRPVDQSGVLPDLAIEIRSSEQPLAELLDKCRRYVAAGVPVALLIDPTDESVRVVRPGREGQPVAVDHLTGDRPLDLGDVLPALALTPRAIFDLAADP